MKSLMLLATMAGLAPAQPKLGEMEILVFSDVIPSMRPQFEASRTTVRDAYKKGGAPFHLMLSTIFARGPQYVSITPLSDLASWDDGPPYRKMMGESAYQKWSEQARAALAGYQFVAVRSVPHLAIQDAPAGSLPVVVIQRSLVAFDRRA